MTSSFPSADKGNYIESNKLNQKQFPDKKNMAHTNADSRVLEDDLGHLENAIDKIVLVSQPSCPITKGLATKGDNFFFSRAMTVATIVNGLRKKTETRRITVTVTKDSCE